MVVEVSFCLSPEYGVLGLGERVASLPASQPAATSENGKYFTWGLYLILRVVMKSLSYICPMSLAPLCTPFSLGVFLIFTFIDWNTVLFKYSHFIIRSDYRSRDDN